MRPDLGRRRTAGGSRRALDPRPLARAALAALALAGPAPAQEPSPRAAGDALRARLAAEGLRADLAGNVRLPVFVGQARAGVLALRTELVTTADGAQVYRLQDRLEVELPGQGAAFLSARADLRADLSAVEVVLETEEPRGPGAVARQRVRLWRDGGRWRREVSRAEGLPVEAPLGEDPPPDVLVLTPPLGAGERLARLVPVDLGRRLSVRALDLESGQGATWRASVEERRRLRLAPVVGEGQAPGPVAGAPADLEGLLVLRQEAAASLWTLRDPGPGGAPWRVAREGGAQRVVALDPRFLLEAPGGAPAVDRVLALLRAASAGDRDAVRDALDLDALFAAVGGGDAEARRVFAEVLVASLTDSAWLRDRGLLVATLAASPEDLVAEPPDAAGRVRVRPRGRAGAQGAGFLLAERDGRWRVVDLPR